MDEQTECVEGTRSRNILTLEERVRAIREFDRVPVYQKVAEIMKCSAKQIRNIVVNREAILLYYASKTGDCQTGFSNHNDRYQKIELLNSVMYEWIQRTQSREDIGRISTKLIRTIALDVKNHIKIPSFCPNKAWLHNFMRAYNIDEDSLLSQKVYDPSAESKAHLSLKISDIVDDVKGNQKAYNNYYKHDSKNETYEEFKSEDDSCSYQYDNSNSGTPDDYDDVRVVIEDDDDEEDEYFEAPAKRKKVDEDETSNSDSGVYINSYEEALQHLKPLEDFVLLEENFRAIGVISQLEAIFRNPEQFES